MNDIFNIIVMLLRYYAWVFEKNYCISEVYTYMLPTCNNMLLPTTQTHTDYASDYDEISFLEFNCSKTVTEGDVPYEMCAVGCYAVLHDDT